VKISIFWFYFYQKLFKDNFSNISDTFFFQSQANATRYWKMIERPLGIYLGIGRFYRFFSYQSRYVSEADLKIWWFLISYSHRVTQLKGIWSSSGKVAFPLMTASIDSSVTLALREQCYFIFWPHPCEAWRHHLLKFYELVTEYPSSHRS